MIYAIVAIDDKRGMATDKGIPWDLPTDRQYYRDKTRDQITLMGYATYLEFGHPMDVKKSLVATTTQVNRPGFEAVPDALEYLKNAKEDVWVIGGAGLLTAVWDTIETIYITRVEGDFGCTKFLPEFEDDFELTEKSKTYRENNTNFHFEVLVRR